MNDRKLTVLTTLAAVLAVGEFGSSIMIWQEHRPGSLPLAAVVLQFAQWRRLEVEVPLNGKTQGPSGRLQL